MSGYAPELHSAAMNIKTAIGDCKIAKDREGCRSDVKLWLDMAIAQLESAYAKLGRHIEASE
jgi:hypothetical protein